MNDHWLTQWKHQEDDTPCDAGFQAPRPRPSTVDAYWWCTEHGMHLVSTEPYSLLQSFVHYEQSVQAVLDQAKIALVNGDFKGASECMTMLTISHQRICERMTAAAEAQK